LKEYPMVVAADEAKGRYYYHKNFRQELFSEKNAKKLMANYIELVDANRECQKDLTK